MDNSNKSKRKREILRTLDNAKTLPSHDREDILIDKILDLEDSLQELQVAYCDVQIYLKSQLCAPLPF